MTLGLWGLWNFSKIRTCHCLLLVLLRLSLGQLQSRVFPWHLFLSLCYLQAQMRLEAACTRYSPRPGSQMVATVMSAENWQKVGRTGLFCRLGNHDILHVSCVQASHCPPLPKSLQLSQACDCPYSRALCSSKINRTGTSLRGVDVGVRYKIHNQQSHHDFVASR